MMLMSLLFLSVMMMVILNSDIVVVAVVVVNIAFEVEISAAVARVLFSPYRASLTNLNQGMNLAILKLRNYSSLQA